MAKVKIGVWQFWRLVGSMNREYPYHDYHVVSNQSTLMFYVVGSNQQAAHGAQHKLFASKSTLIMSTEDTHVHFNNTNNVAVGILANTWYEFKSNIMAVYFPIPASGKYLYLYFEGVLPEEARDPE
jgi:hypothetical protein